jgi:hypothetical protein
MSEGGPRRSAWLRGWRMLVLILLVLAALTAGSVAWWWFDEGDLDAVRTLARQDGRAATWVELKQVPADEVRLACWQRIVVLGKELKSYQDVQGGKPNYAQFKAFTPVPDEMRAHHAALDAAKLAELLTLLDQLGDQPLVLRSEMTFHTLIPEIGAVRGLIRLLAERAALGDAAEAARQCRLALALCRAFHARSLIQHLVRLSVTEIALGMVVARLPELKRVDPGLADDVLATTLGVPNDLVPALNGEFLCALAMADSRLLYDGEGSLGAWYMPLVLRVGRREFLEAQLEAMRELAHHDLRGGLAWSDANDDALRKAKGRFPRPGLILRGMLSPVYGMIVEMGGRTALRGRLVAAELRGQPWPVDSFDPSGAVLRPVSRDGVLVGAYTVGKDGVDDGGVEKQDRYFPLYGPREAPKPAP